MKPSMSTLYQGNYSSGKNNWIAQKGLHGNLLLMVVCRDLCVFFFHCVIQYASYEIIPPQSLTDSWLPLQPQARHSSGRKPDSAFQGRVRTLGTLCRGDGKEEEDE